MLGAVGVLGAVIAAALFPGVAAVLATTRLSLTVKYMETAAQVSVAKNASVLSDSIKIDVAHAGVN